MLFKLVAISSYRRSNLKVHYYSQFPKSRRADYIVNNTYRRSTKLLSGDWFYTLGVF